jgi:hypothetical protein
MILGTDEKEKDFCGGAAPNVKNAHFHSFGKKARRRAVPLPAYRW